MTIHTKTSFVHDSTFNSTPVNEGPLAIPANSKVTALDFDGAVFFAPWATGTATFTGLHTYVVIGWQWGLSGYTPLDVTNNPARDADGQWLVYQGLSRQGQGMWWFPTTASAEVWEVWPVHLRFRGNFPAASALDFYISHGRQQLVSGASGWALEGVARITYVD